MSASLRASKRGAGHTATGYSMIIRLLIISLVAAAFAVGFSELADQSDRMSPQRASMSCQEWPGSPNCPYETPLTP